MGLRIWDQLLDNYDHEQLADNWAKVDAHDHTPGRGVLIPTEGISEGAITSALIADKTIAIADLSTEVLSTLGLKSVVHSGAFAAKAGDFVIQWPLPGEITLPTPAVDARVAAFNLSSGLTTITTVNGDFCGDFIKPGSKSVSLLFNQHVSFQSDGNHYFVMSGEVRHERTWVAQGTLTSGQAYTPSTYRDTEVMIEAYTGQPKSLNVTLYIGGVQLATAGNAAGSPPNKIIETFRVPAGLTWAAVVDSEGFSPDLNAWYLEL